MMTQPGFTSGVAALRKEAVNEAYRRYVHSTSTRDGNFTQVPKDEYMHRRLEAYVLWLDTAQRTVI